MMLTLDGTHHVEPLIQTPSNERNGVVSPDGRWLAYESDSSGQFEIYVKPFPNVNAGQWTGLDGRRHAAALGAETARSCSMWRPTARSWPSRVDARGATWRRGQPGEGRRGALRDRRASRSSRNYDVSRDGQRFLMVKQPAKSGRRTADHRRPELVRGAETARAGEVAGTSARTASRS